ncbi:MAG: hypothetical protein ABSA80_20870 [Terriglobales bacterium]
MRTGSSLHGGRTPREFGALSAAEAQEYYSTMYVFHPDGAMMTELRPPFTLEAFAYSGGPIYREHFSGFEEAKAECDRMNRRDEWVAWLLDASGATVRDHAAPEVFNEAHHGLAHEFAD